MIPEARPEPKEIDDDDEEKGRGSSEEEDDIVRDL